jgi:hypothetical protein
MNYENQFLNVIGSGVTSNINRSSLTTQDFSMPNIPQQSVVVRGSALSNVNRANLVMESRPNVGEVATLDPLVRQKSQLEGQLETINAQIDSLINLMNTTINTKSTQKGIYDDLKDKIEKSDSANPVSPFKMTASQRAIAVQNMQTAWNAYQTASASLITYKSQLDDLISKRDNLVNQLKTLGVPPSRFRGLINRKDLASRIQSMEQAGATNPLSKLEDEIKNTFSGGFGGGGFGGGGGADIGEEGTDSANQSFFGKNKMAILALGGVVGYLLLKR